MRTSDDSIGSLAHPREVLACDEAATTGPRRVEDDLRGAGTWRGLDSPTQVAQLVDTQALMPPVRRGLVSLLVCNDGRDILLRAPQPFAQMTLYTSRNDRAMVARSNSGW
jgi:hypothetical protein